MYTGGLFPGLQWLFWEAFLETFKLWCFQRGREGADILSRLQQISWYAFRLLGLQRRTQAVVLCVAVLQGGLRTVSSVSLCAVELQGGFQTVGSVALHAAEELLGCLQAVVSSVEQTCWWAVTLYAQEFLECLQGVVSVSCSVWAECLWFLQAVFFFIFHEVGQTSWWSSPTEVASQKGRINIGGEHPIPSLPRLTISYKFWS